jgi:hypothetical protein
VYQLAVKLSATLAIYRDNSPAEEQASLTTLQPPILLSLYKYTYCVIWYLAPVTAHWPTGLGRYRAGLGAKALGVSQTGKDGTVCDREKLVTVGTGRGPAKVGAQKRQCRLQRKINRQPAASETETRVFSSPSFSQPHRLLQFLLLCGPLLCSIFILSSLPPKRFCELPSLYSWREA